jgi:hypothetical protein
VLVGSKTFWVLLMKVALVTTTINVPHVLRLYRRCDADVRFFIALDEKSPADEIDELCARIGNAAAYAEGSERWRCEPLLGHNTIGRRNIATLEALKWGAGIVVFVDDDNIPTNLRYFADYECALASYPQSVRNTVRLGGPHSGLLASPEVDWFDVGAFLDPPSPHRGFPPEWAGRQPRLSHVVDAKVGACAGIVMGDPDVSAITRIARRPHVLNVSPLLNAGIAVDPRHTRTVFNTQNSAVVRELVPAMLLCPQFRRYDDIVASLVCQRIMCDLGYHVLFGQPYVYQERNAHDLGRDLADEAWGNENILKVQSLLWNGSLTGTVAQKAEACYWALDKLVPNSMPGVGTLASAWVEDCERAMS